ncbi:MAG: synthase [Bacillota bacterium]|jgi:NAD+ synthase|nr:synthase [Bacillota bacterium]MDK2925704.1 synthase [Bacillota bacterium]MDK2959995.1 synthase [Bacillota bacterium]
METSELAARLSAWIKEKVEEAGRKGVVFGLSGGIDSAVVAGLAKRAFPHNSLGVIMPCHSLPQDAEHARLVAERFDLPVREIILDEAYDALLSTLRAAEPSSPKELALANIKPRLRMITLYYLATQHDYLVLGTGNKSELTVGYFTKYGDAGVDLLPLGNLVKEQVRALARYLGVPEAVIAKAPSAGLWEGQTDEAEMGLTYAELDRYILTGEGRPEVIGRIQAMRQKSEHKRRLPPVPDF